MDARFPHKQNTANPCQQCDIEPTRTEICVPQGSVLGPLLFLLLIGDIDQGVTRAFFSCFADDTKIGCRITSENDSEALHVDLETVYNWTEQNNMKLNSDRFECMRYGSNKTPQALTHYTTNTGSMIQDKDSVKDLGVTKTNDGTFKKYIQHAVSEAKRQCGWILRTFGTSIVPMLTLWKSLVQYKVDYCSQLWCPTETGDIQSIEMV